MDGQVRIGWVGGFRPFHGLELLPAFADELHAVVPRAVLYLVGTGPLRRQVEGWMADRPWVRVVGAVPHHDVPRWIRSFDVAILAAGSQRFHYSPLKLYEYLACGAAVVAPDVGDIGREVANGHEAVLVPAGDPAAMVRAVRSLVDDPGLRRQLSQAAREKAVSAFSWGARAASIVRALQGRKLWAGPLACDDVRMGRAAEGGSAWVR
jgi:glycosyltransferase involved in cell wall biosynthesis